MTVDIIKFAYVAGEISQSFFARTDLEKYDLGMAIVDNWFVDYRGGLTTRAGSEFIDYVKNDDLETKFFKFTFASDIANTNVLLFGHNYIRFIQDGAYVLEAAKTITNVTQANPGVVTTSGAHGFSSGDWVKVFGVGGMLDVNNQLYQITVLSPTTFSIQDAYGSNVSTAGFGAYTGDGEVGRVYTIASPYASTDLTDLRCHQIRDTLRFTHPNYKVRNLRRNGQTNWALSEETFENALARPVGLTLVASGAGDAAVGFVVTAVNAQGEESLPSEYAFIDDIVNYTVTAGQVTAKWTPVGGARYYNVYRTRVAGNSDGISRSFQVGYVGRSTGAHFVDTNIIPDFTRTPPQDNNPFADAAITQIDITNGGANYSNATTITINDPTGTGFQGYLVISTTHASATGPIAGVVIVKGGSGYTNPTVVLGAPGSGATFDVTVGPASGNNPFVGAIFQQRQVYGANMNTPLGIWGSRPGKLSNFGTSEIVISSDSFEYEIDSEDVSAIRHLFATRGGLLVFNQSGIYQLFGANNAPLTPSNAIAEPHAYKGATKLPPIKIDSDILYCEGKGGTVRLLTYDDRLKVYAGTDVSILSNHLIDNENQITHWSFADEPFKTVWSCRSDGELLCLTILKDQNVFAWTRAHTQGLYEDVIAIQEENIDTVYLMVKRYIGGRWRKYIEKFQVRKYDNIEDAFCVDAGLALTPNEGTVELTLSSATGLAAASTNAPYFVVGDVGRVIRAGGGKMNITGFVDDTHVSVEIVRDVSDVFLETGLPKPFPAGAWTIDTPVSTLRGLFHLEGQTVQILADGNVLPAQIVSNGIITLPRPATRIVIGLQFKCIAQTLPPTIQGAIIEDKRKRIVGSAVRLSETRGLKSGAQLSNLYPMKERTNEDWGEPTRVFNGVKVIMLEPIWDEDGQTYFVQDDPLPATILGHVIWTDVGDNDSRD